MVLVSVLEEELKGKGYGMEVGGGVVPAFLQGLLQTVARDTGMSSSRKEEVARLFFGRALYRVSYRNREAPEYIVVQHNLQGETDVPEFEGYDVPRSPEWTEESDDDREARLSRSCNARLKALYEACGDATEGETEEVATIRRDLDSKNMASSARQQLRKEIEDADFQWIPYLQAAQASLN